MKFGYCQSFAVTPTVSQHPRCPIIQGCNKSIVPECDGFVVGEHGVDLLLEGGQLGVPERHLVLAVLDLCCQMAKFDPFLSLDCARVEGVGAQSKERKGSNFAA